MMVEDRPIMSVNIVSQFQSSTFAHKVVYRHYSGEVENNYITLQQIYSGNGVPSFIRIARVL